MLSHSNKLLFRRQGLVVAGAVPTGVWVGAQLCHFPCLALGWGWVGGWDVNVPCMLHRLWMLRYSWVGLGG